MATDQPATGPPARALDILFVTTTDPNDLGCPFPNLRSIFVCHLPHEVDEEGNVKFLKNGYWKPGGTCSECGDLGPAYFHCIRCDPMGFLYVPDGITQSDIVLDDQRSEGRMAHLIHNDIISQPDPAAARTQFLLKFDSCQANDKPFWDNNKPRPSMTQDETASGQKNLTAAANLMHSTILCQPDPVASRSYFLLLLESYWADRIYNEVLLLLLLLLL
jgi:hypothetical protein